MSGLELRNPLGLFLLLGVVPIVAFYILKIQRQRQRVSSTWLWSAAQRDLRAKDPFRKLIAEVPLIVQLFALCLLTLTLARPTTRGGNIAGDHVAIVVDTSASMGTSSHGQNAGADRTTRMSEARDAALGIIAALSPGADAIVIEGGREARVVSPLERDARHLRAAVSSLSVRDVEGDLSPAVALAVDRMRSLSGKRRIIVITDGALARPTALKASGFDTELMIVGDAEDNAAIVRIDVRAGVDPSTGREQIQVFAMVRNYATKPRDAYLTVRIDGRADPLTSRRLLIGPGEKAPVVLTFEPSDAEQGRGMVVQLSPEDALPVDDVAFARIPMGHKMSVALASRATYSWTLRALDAAPELELQRVTLEQLGTVNIDPDALVVIEGACPANAPGHDLMIVAPPAGTCLGVTVGEVIEQPQPTSWEAGDARLRFVTFDGVHVARASRLGTEGLAAGLVRAGTTTLIADASLPGRTVTVLGFDPGESDWPLKASFVLFVRNVVEIARLHRAEGGIGPIRTGEPLRIVVPSGVSSIRVDGPMIPEHEVTAKGGFAIVPSVDRAGFYHVRWTEPHIGEVLVAANLASELESDVRARPVTIEAAGADAGTTTASSMSDAHHEWNGWLAFGSVLALAFDLWWLTRRPRSRPLLASTRGSR